MTNRYRIEELHPDVASIQIKFKREYLSAFGLIEDKEYRVATYQPSFGCSFVVPCINRDCTWDKFDLDSIISCMIAQRETNKCGKVRCEGKEARDHSNDCPCVLNYEVEIAYK